MQEKLCSAAEGQTIATMVVDTLQSLRNDASFELFWSKVTSITEPLDIEPLLPHQRKVPESGTGAAHFHQSPEDMYRQHYTEAIDLAVNCIRDRFQQSGYEVYRNLEQLLLKASQNLDFSAEFTFITSFYRDDLQTETLCMLSC